MSRFAREIALIEEAGLFDRDWYLTEYPDVQALGMDPIEHYLRLGVLLRRNPGPGFDTGHYLTSNPDVAEAGVHPLLHYLAHGRREGRAPRPHVVGPAETASPLMRYQGNGRSKGHKYCPPRASEEPGEAGPAAARPLVDVIVPVYNALDDVQSCLASLTIAKSGFHTRVLVVNDGSDAATTAWLRRAVIQLAGPGVSFELFEHKTNRGYTAAVNTGLHASRADYAVTLNSDTIVTSGWLDGMVRCLESAPEIGIVGPLSNAATWQNVPELYDPAGQHAINTLPDGMTPEHMAKLVREVSGRRYPRTTFVNGFCFLTARAVIEAVGYMDEDTFTTGYGEENDFCIRAMDAGFALAYADEVYVFHAKSKSFGTERRLALSRAGGEALRRKHGTDKVTRLLQKVQKIEEMDAVRAQIRTALDRFTIGGDVVSAKEMRLLPSAVYATKGYRLDPDFAGPVLMLPFEGGPGRVPELDIGIHLHLHYLDLLDEFAGYLSNVPVPFHLYTSVPEGSDTGAVRARLAAVLPRPTVRVEASRNRGRDIGPFLATFGRALAKHDYVCHIHSKRSPHTAVKKDWRMQLMTNLMGSQAIVAEILRLFDQNSDLGMVFPEYHWSLENQISWGTNYAICTELARRLGIPISPVQMVPFPAGSMFWARKAALAPLFDLDLGFADFAEEARQIDGTLAHAVERLFGNIVAATGHKLRQVCSAKPYDLQSYYTAAWPYPTKPARELHAIAETYRAERAKMPARVGLLCANAGGYDATVMHEHLDPQIDYHMVADFPAPDCGFWIRHDMAKDGCSTWRARAVKTNPLPYIGEYDIGIWIDANVMIRGSLERYFRMVEANPNVPVFGIPHPHRDCIYDEAQAVILHNKAAPEKVRAQMATYAGEGYPKRLGLIETNFLIYNLHHPRIAEVLAAWHKEVAERSHRDQLSLNYVLWKLGLDWKPLMGEGRCLRAHHDFAYFGHGRNGGYTTAALPAHTLTPRESIRAA